MEKELDALFMALLGQAKDQTYIGEIAIITIKSLLPSKEDLGVRLDYRRFMEELKLWSYYRTGYNKSLFNIRNLEPDLYFREGDDSIFARILALVIANKDLEILSGQLIKNILFTSGSLEDLFENLLLARLLAMKLAGQEDYVAGLKEFLISFAQDEFLENYGGFYRLDTSLYRGNFKVDFEMEKVKLLSFLNGASLEGYSGLREVLALLLGEELEPGTLPARTLEAFLSGQEAKLANFYKTMASYLVRLRAGRIDPDLLYIKDYVLPDIFEFEEGQVFFHSLLGEARLVRKEEGEGETALVQTKTGFYLLKK